MRIGSYFFVIPKFYNFSKKVCYPNILSHCLPQRESAALIAASAGVCYNIIRKFGRLISDNNYWLIKSQCREL